MLIGIRATIEGARSIAHRAAAGGGVALALVAGTIPAGAAVHPLSAGGSWSDVVASPSSRAPRLDPTGRFAVYLDDAEADGVEELWSAALLGGAPIRLSGAMSGGDAVFEFAIASDGEFVAFRAAYGQDPAQLYVVPIEGGQPLRVSHELDPGAYVASFQISPDAQWLLYIAETDPGQLDLFRVAATGGSVSGYTFENQTICTQFVESFAISPDSSLVAFRTSLDCSGQIRPNRHLYRVPLSGTAATLVAASYDEGFVGRYDFTRPASPGVPVLIFLFDLDGPNGYLGTNQPVKLQWSKGGTFGSDHEISGTIVQGGGVTSFVPVPGSQQVVFRADREIDEVFELYLTTAGVNGVVQVPVQIHEDLFSTWVRELYAVSPAGDRVVFAVEDNPIGSVDYERLRVASLAVPGSSLLLAEPVAGGATFRRLEVSGDSQRAVYTVDLSEVERIELFSSPLAGGAAARLNPTGHPIFATWDVLDFALAPDGSRVHFVYYFADALIEDVRLYSSPIAGGGLSLFGPTIPWQGSYGFYGLWAPVDPDWAVALCDDATPLTLRLVAANVCVLCDGFEGTGDGLSRWSDTVP